MTDRDILLINLECERIDVCNIIEVALKLHPELIGTQVYAKAYQVLPHGSELDEELKLINVDNLSEELSKFRLDIFRGKDWLAWQTGISGVFYKDGIPEFFIPMLDLEFPSSGDVSQDINILGSHFNSLDIEGGIFKSGDSGVGGYYFVGYEPLKYSPEYWRFMGKVLTVMSFGNSLNSDFAKQAGLVILEAQSLEEAQKVANLILKFYPSIKNGETREGLYCDPRWIAHRLLQGFSILRYTPGKSYEDRPLQVAWMADSN